MPYVSRDLYNWYNYVHGTEVLANFPGLTANTNSVTPVLLFEYTLKNRIQATSKFSVSFDISRLSGATTGYARIYRNGVAVGTQRSTTTGTWANHSENLGQVDWKIGDKIQLYGWCSTTGTYVQCQNFQIKGLGSQWANTYNKT